MAGEAKKLRGSLAKDRSGASGVGVKEQGMEVDRTHAKEAGRKHNKDGPWMEPAELQAKGVTWAAAKKTAQNRIRWKTLPCFGLTFR